MLVDTGKGLLTDHVAHGLSLATAVDPARYPAAPQLDATFPGLDPTVDAWLSDPPDAPEDPTARWAAHTQRAIRAARAECTGWNTVHEIATQERVVDAHSGVGVAGGTLVHTVLEDLDLTAPKLQQLASLDRLVAASGRSLGLDEATVGICAGLLRRVLDHPVLDRARAAPERWSEVPFAIRDGERLVSGRIDLAFPTDASRRSWVVVDWKSDLPPRNTAAWRNYERQLAWYARALLQAVSPCESVEAVLVGPHPDLGPGPSVAEIAGVLFPELGPGLSALLDQGMAPPRLGALVGDPPHETTLAWPEAQVALAVGLPLDGLAAQGWQCVSVDPAGPDWADRALAAVAELLTDRWCAYSCGVSTTA